MQNFLHKPFPWKFIMGSIYIMKHLIILLFLFTASCSTKHLSSLKWQEKKGYRGTDYYHCNSTTKELIKNNPIPISKELLKLFKKMKKGGYIYITTPTPCLATGEWVMKGDWMERKIWLELKPEREKQDSLNRAYENAVNKIYQEAVKNLPIHTLDSLDYLHTSERQEKKAGLNENVLRTLIDSSMLQFLFMDEIQVKEWQEKEKEKEKLYTLDIVLCQVFDTTDFIDDFSKYVVFLYSTKNSEILQAFKYSKYFDHLIDTSSVSFGFYECVLNNEYYNKYKISKVDFIPTLWDGVADFYFYSPIIDSSYIADKLTRNGWEKENWNNVQKEIPLRTIFRKTINRKYYTIDSWKWHDEITLRYYIKIHEE